MARKSEGTPRKTASSRKSTAKQPGEVTPIRETPIGAVLPNGGVQLPDGVEDEIRVRAYQLFQERGGQHGFDLEDWRRAEVEILSRYQREKSA